MNCSYGRIRIRGTDFLFGHGSHRFHVNHECWPWIPFQIFQYSNRSQGFHLILRFAAAQRMDLRGSHGVLIEFPLKVRLRHPHPAWAVVKHRAGIIVNIAVRIAKDEFGWRCEGSQSLDRVRRSAACKLNAYLRHSAANYRGPENIDNLLDGIDWIHHR